MKPKGESVLESIRKMEFVPWRERWHEPQVRGLRHGITIWLAEKEGIKCLAISQTTLGANTDYSLSVLKEYVWNSKESVFRCQRNNVSLGERFMIKGR